MDDRAPRRADGIASMTTLTPDESARLRDALVGAGEEVNGDLRSRVISGGRSNLTLRIEDDERAWALRRPPTGGVIESAHDVGREFRVVRALGPTAVPVARAVTADDSGNVLGFPFGVTEFVPGLVARSRGDVEHWRPADFIRCADGLLDALVALHSVDPGAVGLGEFGRRTGYVERQLSRWSRQWQLMGSDDARADRLLEALQRRVPEQPATTVVHGDYRVDNVLLDPGDPGRVLAVVDWELATLGDPHADVALMCVYRHEVLDWILGLPAAWTSSAFPSPAELLAGYEDRRSARVPSFSFHLGLGYYKLAVITEGIAYRHRLGATAGEGYERVASAVPVLLEAGLEVLDGE